jgi:hypothetical protein
MSDTNSSVVIKFLTTGDWSALVQGREQMEAMTTAVNIAKTALSGFGVGLGLEGIKSLVTSSLELGKSIENLSARVQISTQAFQVLGKVAQESGLDQESMSTILAKLRGTIDTAAESGGKAAKAFQVLGLNAKVLSQAPLEDSLIAIARAVANASDKTAAYSAAVEILGVRNMPKLVEMLNKLAHGGYDEAAKSATLLSDTEIQTLKKSSDAWDAFFNKIHVGFAELTAFAIDHGKTIVNAVSLGSDPLAVGGAAINGIIGAFSGPSAGDFHGPGITNAPTASTQAADALAASSAAQNQQDAMALTSQEGMNAAKKEELDITKKIAEAVQAGLEATKKQGDAIQRGVDAANKLTDPFTEQEKQAEQIKTAWQAGALNMEQAKAALESLSDEAWDKALKLAAFDFDTGGGKGVEKEQSKFTQITDAYEASQASGVQGNPNYLSATQAAQAALMEYATKVGAVGQQLEGVFTTVTSSISGGLAHAFDGLLMKTMTLGQAFRSIWQSFVSSMFSAFSEMLAQYIVKKAAMFAIDELMAAKGLLLSLATSAKSLLAWLPAAIAASISSYGLAAAIGTAAVIALVAGFREQGGPVESGSAYVVGEKRPEVFVPNTSGFIVPSVGEFQSKYGGDGSSMVSPARGSGPSSGGGGGGDQHHFYLYTDVNQAMQHAARNPSMKKTLINTLNGKVRGL